MQTPDGAKECQRLDSGGSEREYVEKVGKRMRLKLKTQTKNRTKHTAKITLKCLVSIESEWKTIQLNGFLIIKKYAMNAVSSASLRALRAETALTSSTRTPIVFPSSLLPLRLY